MPLVAGLAISSGVSAYGAHKASQGAQKAAGQQSDSVQQAMNLLGNQWGQTQQTLAPYLQTGQDATMSLASLLGLTPRLGQGAPVGGLPPTLGGASGAQPRPPASAMPPPQGVSSGLRPTMGMPATPQGAGLALGTQRTINGTPAQWDGRGWKAVQ